MQAINQSVQNMLGILIAGRYALDDMDVMISLFFISLRRADKKKINVTRLHKNCNHDD
jgi:hypothetical protein